MLDAEMSDIQNTTDDDHGGTVSGVWPGKWAWLHAVAQMSG